MILSSLNISIAPHSINLTNLFHRVTSTVFKSFSTFSGEFILAPLASIQQNVKQILLHVTSRTFICSCLFLFLQHFLHLYIHLRMCHSYQILPNFPNHLSQSTNFIIHTITVILYMMLLVCLKYMPHFNWFTPFRYFQNCSQKTHFILSNTNKVF
jgi:hypothetical protein